MLLKHEMYKERALVDLEYREEATRARTFRHLKIKPVRVGGQIDYYSSRDLLVSPLSTKPIDNAE